jgi:hypothetical protein
VKHQTVNVQVFINGGNTYRRTKEEASTMESPSNKTTGLAFEQTPEYTSQVGDGTTDDEQLTYEQLLEMHEFDKAMMSNALYDFQRIAEISLGVTNKGLAGSNTAERFDALEEINNIILNWVF